ncbi:MAG: integrase, partial [Planctomycetota bacterium]
MSRQSKPYYRKAQKRWVCTIDGKRITLGTDKEEAHRKFHELMLDRENLAAEINTLYGLSQAYLDWVEKHRAAGTYANQLRILKSFIDNVGKIIKVAALKNHHLTKWTDSKDDWTSTSKNDAISTVLRMLNWAVEQGYILRSPIAKISKPKRMPREIYYTTEQWKAICSHVKDGFIDLLDFLWSTGCRPKEARELEARHV